MIKSVEEAVEAYEKSYPEIEYNFVAETPTWYIFSYTDSEGGSDPIGVNKETGECRGIVPPIDIPDLKESKVVWDRRE